MRSIEYQKNLLNIIKNIKKKDKKFYVSTSCVGEYCGIEGCGLDATHKIGEEISNDDPNRERHNLTSYICCRHYQEILGEAAEEQCKANKHPLYYKMISKKFK